MLYPFLFLVCAFFCSLWRPCNDSFQEISSFHTEFYVLRFPSCVCNIWCVTFFPHSVQSTRDNNEQIKCWSVENIFRNHIPAVSTSITKRNYRICTLIRNDQSRSSTANKISFITCLVWPFFQSCLVTTASHYRSDTLSPSLGMVIKLHDHQLPGVCCLFIGILHSCFTQCYKDYAWSTCHNFEIHYRQWDQ